MLHTMRIEMLMTDFEMTDFESSMVTALKQIYLCIPQVGCLFYFFFRHSYGYIIPR